MNFLKPGSLYLFFLIPLLLLLYVLRLRRKTYVVSSSLLWEQAIEDMKANTPFQRFRRNLLLPLQILFLTLAIFALARPFWRGAASAAQNNILVIDCSASMQATDGDGKATRFEAARSAVVKMIDDLKGDDKIMLIKAGLSPEIISNLTSDKLQLREALRKIHPVDASIELDRAMQLASSLARNTPNSEITLLSDGAGKSALMAGKDGEPDRADVPVRFISFGKNTASNVGITAFAAGRSPTDALERQVFVELQSFSDIEKRSLLLELYYNDNLMDVRELNLASGERRSVIFDGLRYTEGSIKIELDLDDDLDVDDRAYYILAERDLLKVLLVGVDSSRLETAIRTMSTGLQLSSEKPDTYSTDEGYDVIVFDGFVPGNLPDKNVLFVNPGADLPFGRLLSYNDNPAVIDWDRSHPVMRFVDLSDLKVRRSHSYEMPGWMKPLVESDMGTLVWLGENDGRRIIVLPFDIQFRPSNNFTMLAAFPIFISNALNWLAGVDAEASARQLSPGQPIRLPLSGSTVNQVVMVEKPDGSEKVSEVSSGRIVFDDTDAVGIYTVTGEGFNEKFAVNLLNEAESNIKPADKIEVGGKKIVSSSISTVSDREMWSSLVLAAIVLLAVEWWVYHRRILV